MRSFRTMVRVLAGTGLCAAASLGFMVTSHACTSVYVGSEVSDDGSYILARSNDARKVMGNHVVITERVENEPGRTMRVDKTDSIYVEIPATTYRYIGTPMMDSGKKIIEEGDDEAVCVNEYGVAMTMSVTAFANHAAMDADPWVKTGLTEFTANDLVICQSADAREAVEVLLSLIDEYGSSESNIALISDQKEAWYVEMYTGHQYAAVKLPSDRVSVFGNEFCLEYLSAYEDYIISEDLEDLAVENGFAVYGDDHELNLYETYSGYEVAEDYSRMRSWIGHQILAPSQFSKDYDINTLYPLCFIPDQPVTVIEVMDIMKNQYQGTEYCPGETGRIDMRVIGTNTALSTHIVQIYPDLPADRSCVLWESSGPSAYGVFVPFSNAALSISDPYSRNQSAEDVGVFDLEQYPYYRFKAISTMVSENDDYDAYAVPVREYWKTAEAGMVQGMSDVLLRIASMSDPEVAGRYITDYCNMLQEKAFEDAGALVNEIMWYKSENSNIMKMGIDPETRELLQVRVQIDPMVITLDDSLYWTVPNDAVEPDGVQASENAEASDGVETYDRPKEVDDENTFYDF